MGDFPPPSLKGQGGDLWPPSTGRPAARASSPGESSSSVSRCGGPSSESCPIAIIYGVVVGTTKTLALGLFDADDWISFTIQGLARGAVYALIALGYTLVYGILLIINFAHGEVFMAGAYTAFFVAMGLARTGVSRTPSRC